jgi:hypothetical protein
MKRIITLTALFAAAGLAFGQATPTANPRLWGKTSIPALTRVIDANFALVDAALDALGDLSGTLEPGEIYVGNATSNAAAVAVSGDVTIATNGAVTIANAAVTLAKMANMATLSVIGRSTASAGVPEVLTAATDHHVLRRSGSALGFGLIGNDNVASNAAIVGSKLDLSAPGTIGGTTPAAGTFTTMKANAIMSAPVALGGITNGQAIAISGSVMSLTAVEAATNTLANPTLVGQVAVLANVGAENITIARGANVALGAASRVITPNGTLTLLGISSTLWLELANSIDNATSE